MNLNKDDELIQKTLFVKQNCHFCKYIFVTEGYLKLQIFYREKF